MHRNDGVSGSTNSCIVEGGGACRRHREMNRRGRTGRFPPVRRRLACPSDRNGCRCVSPLVGQYESAFGARPRLRVKFASTGGGQADGSFSIDSELFQFAVGSETTFLFARVDEKQERKVRMQYAVRMRFAGSLENFRLSRTAVQRRFARGHSHDQPCAAIGRQRGGTAPKAASWFGMQSEVVAAAALVRGCGGACERRVLRSGLCACAPSAARLFRRLRWMPAPDPSHEWAARSDVTSACALRSDSPHPRSLHRGARHGCDVTRADAITSADGAAWAPGPRPRCRPYADKRR